MARRRGILILCGDADGNLGDRAILTATCQAIRSNDPTEPITVVSRAPERMREELKVRALRAGPLGLLALCRAAWGSRLVLVGGGGLFQDDDSRVKMPYWAARCWLARLLCPRVFGHSLGVGPLDSRIGRFSARIAFASMRAISVRDPEALATARSLSRAEIELVPDPAFALAPDPELDGAEILARSGVALAEGPLIGVAVRRWFPPRPRWIPHRIASRFGDSTAVDDASRHLVDLWADVLDRVLDATGGQVVMLPTYPSDSEGDHRLSAQILAAMRSERTHLLRIHDPESYLAVAGRISLMVGGRMHPTILAAAAGTPVVGLAYNPKFAGTFELMGIPDRWLDVRVLVETGDSDAFVDLILDALRSSASSDTEGAGTATAAVSGVRSRPTALADRTRSWVARVMTSC